MAAVPGIHITVQVDDFTRELLIGSGWTPPGEQPILNSEHRRILAEQASDHRNAMAKLQGQHRDTLRQQSENHHRILEREEKRIREEYSARGRHDGCVTWEDHRDALRHRAKEVRAAVAEEIAVDLEKPREWRISPEKPAPWADVARAHDGGKLRRLPFPLTTWTDVFHTS